MEWRHDAWKNKTLQLRNGFVFHVKVKVWVGK
jgi:hypothetical protein